MTRNFYFLGSFVSSVSSFPFDSLASSFMSCNDEKLIFAIYWALYDMCRCVYHKEVEDELSVCLKTKIPSCIPKSKLKLCICI